MKKGSVFNTFGLMKWLWFTLVLLLLVGCEKASDGPLSVSQEQFDYRGEGYFTVASLDSGKTIHLSKDTLFLMMGRMWTFSNCALQSIDLNWNKEDSVLWIAPKLRIRATEEDCPAPYYRPDTLLAIILKEEQIEGIAMIKVKNDADSLLDSILIRRGNIQKDTFFVYMDSSFTDYHAYPLRTKDTKNGKNIPTIFRVLDSLTPRKFYWRTMRSTCTYRISMCTETVPDTIYPTSWKINDTNLVPIHYACADSTLSYCINSKWENDSTSLGELQERPDTIWHYSTYYAEKIPECGTYNSFAVSNYSVGSRVRFIRELFSPDSKETFCGPASQKKWMVYNLSGNNMVVDSDSISVLDTLYKIWEDAAVAPDTLKEK